MLLLALALSCANGWVDPCCREDLKMNDQSNLALSPTIWLRLLCRGGNTTIPISVGHFGVRHATVTARGT